MKTTKYLYGIEAIELENKFYKEALQYKLEAGKKLYSELMPKENKDKETRKRMFYVFKALEHTRKLIEELNGE